MRWLEVINLQGIIADMIMLYIPEAKTITFPSKNRVQFNYRDIDCKLHFDEDTCFKDIKFLALQLKNAAHKLGDFKLQDWIKLKGGK